MLLGVGVLGESPTEFGVSPRSYLATALPVRLVLELCFETRAIFLGPDTGPPRRLHAIRSSIHQISESREDLKGPLNRVNMLRRDGQLTQSLLIQVANKLLEQPSLHVGASSVDSVSAHLLNFLP